MNVKKLALRLSAVPAVLFGAGAAQAQTTGIDVADVVTTIAAQATPIAAIGGAVLAIVVGVKAFKWVRAALS